MFSDSAATERSMTQFLFKETDRPMCNLLANKQFFLKKIILVGFMSHEEVVAVWRKYDLSPSFYLSWG